MRIKNQVIEDVFQAFSDIRYVAIYKDKNLVSRQKENPDSSSSETDNYEELLVNPVLITAARQRGNIDCGGLKFLIIGYGNFYQLIKEIKGGHISICLNKDTDLTNVPEKIFSFLDSNYPQLFSEH